MSLVIDTSPTGSVPCAVRFAAATGCVDSSFVVALARAWALSRSTPKPGSVESLPWHWSTCTPAATGKPRVACWWPGRRRRRRHPPRRTGLLYGLGRAHRPRARGPRARRARQTQRGDRPRTVGRPVPRAQAPREHLRQARRQHPHRGRRPRAPTWHHEVGMAASPSDS